MATIGTPRGMAFRLQTRHGHLHKKTGKPSRKCSASPGMPKPEGYRKAMPVIKNLKETGYFVAGDLVDWEDTACHCPFRFANTSVQM